MANAFSQKTQSPKPVLKIVGSPENNAQSQLLIAVLKNCILHNAFQDLLNVYLRIVNLWISSTGTKNALNDDFVKNSSCAQQKF